MARKKLTTKALDSIDDLMGGMSKRDKQRLGRMIGLVAGEIANEKYRSSTDAERRNWDQNRIMHHGDFGAIVGDYGRKKKNPLLKGLGSGLEDSDRQDETEWVYSKFLVQKPQNKKRKARRR